jgi:hypothetical protein
LGTLVRQKAWKILRDMTDQFFYVRLTFTTRNGSHPRQHEAVVEIAKQIVRRKQSEVTNDIPREKEIALDLARRAALTTISFGEAPVEFPYDEDAIWCEDRHPVMNDRPCDHEENGARTWRI